MSTTLNEARAALIKLSAQFPAPSTYATLLSTLSDYFDCQVPLNIENQSLHQRIKVLEAHIGGVRAALPEDPAIVTISIPAPVQRKPIECSAWIGRGCKCAACRVGQHA